MFEPTCGGGALLIPIIKRKPTINIHANEFLKQLKAVH